MAGGIIGIKSGDKAVVPWGRARFVLSVAGGIVIISSEGTVDVHDEMVRSFASEVAAAAGVG